jgi:HAD superfamily hydrolase (TIGR01549 family)
MPHRFQAILFDLDGTLLDSSMEKFLPHYFAKLAARVADVAPPKVFIAHLLEATEAMVANNGRATNEEVFSAAFYPFAGRTRAQLEPIFVDFYERDFPALRELTQRKADARPAVERAFAQGYKVAIATNPLFPEAAIRQRMAWAGVDDFPYDWVTTYENSRFCKPNLCYFDAIAARLDLPAEACLVVGDEDMDMVAARAGFSTYLVPSAATALSPETPEPMQRGSLEELTRLLETL